MKIRFLHRYTAPLQTKYWYRSPANGHMNKNESGLKQDLRLWRRICSNLEVFQTVVYYNFEGMEHNLGRRVNPNFSKSHVKNNCLAYA